MLRVPLQEMLNSLLSRQAEASSPPAIQPAQKEASIRPAQSHQSPPRRTPDAASPPRRTHQTTVGLRSKGLDQYRLDELAKGAKTFSFELEALWTDLEVFTIEAIGWQHYTGAVEVLEIWSGDQGREGFQKRSVTLDNRGYYVLLQVHHDGTGTRWRSIDIPRSGIRAHMRWSTRWQFAFEDNLPKGLTAEEALVTHVALSLLTVQQRDETDIQWFSRRRDTPVLPVQQRYQMQ